MIGAIVTSSIPGAPAMSDTQTPITLGWREWISLPDLDIPALKAKVDTGARTSALTAFDLEPFEESGVSKIRFGVRPLLRRPELTRECTAEVVDRRTVTDSGGHRERRCVIETRVQVAGELWPVEVTLTDRQGMLFPMLLGRTALAGRAVVDPSESYLCGRSLARSYRKQERPA